jgi:hypothetical protein
LHDRIPIAERTVFAVDKDGQEFEIRAAVGVPYEAESGSWACPVCLEGLRNLPDMYGVDSLQALLLALKAIRNMLSYFVEQGGKLYWEKGGEELTVDELFEDREEITPDPPPTDEQQKRIDQLTADQIKMIDEAILANVSSQWRKVARVAGSAMTALENIVPPTPDIFYANRVRHLVAAGKLESRGNLLFMRFSEVRLPNKQK